MKVKMKIKWFFIGCVILLCGADNEETFTLRVQCLYFDSTHLRIERPIENTDQVMTLEGTYYVWKHTLYRNWLQSHDTLLNRPAEPDLNLDGIVNLEDFNILIQGMQAATKTK